MALSDDLYEKLTEEEDARLCRDIDEHACRESPQNFFYLLTSQFLTKLASHTFWHLAPDGWEKAKINV